MTVGCAEWVGLVWGMAFRPVNPKCARLQRLRRAAGCFGEIAGTPNPGRGLRFPVGGYITAIAPILTQTPLPKTAA